MFEDAREGAGIYEWPNNALRHSFTSYHIPHFKDAKSLALETGQMNSGTTFAHYRQLVKPKEAERFWNIRPAMTGKIVPMLGKSNAEIEEFLRTAKVISCVPNTRADP